MRALVTGAAGFIGRHVVPLAAARGIEVIAVSRTQTGAAEGVRWVTGDVLADGSLDAVIEREQPTHLLHLAWITEPGTYWTSPDNAKWAAASARLFERFYSANGKRAVAAGTCAEHDWSGARVDDHTALRPRTPYGVAKQHARESLATLAGRAGASHAWGRIHFLFGDGEPATRFFPSLARPLLRGQPAICRKPSLVRDWLHVADVAAAFVALLDAPIEGAVSIVSGEAVSHGDLARRIAAEARHPECLHVGDTLPDAGEPLEIRGTAGALADHWAPRLSLDTGIIRAVASLRESTTA